LTPVWHLAYPFNRRRIHFTLLDHDFPLQGEYFSRLIDVSPVSAVLEAWADLERDMATKLVSHDEAQGTTTLRAGKVEEFLYKETATGYVMSVLLVQMELDAE
jgi:hypothetical protein